MKSFFLEPVSIDCAEGIEEAIEIGRQDAAVAAMVMIQWSRNTIVSLDVVDVVSEFEASRS